MNQKTYASLIRSGILLFELAFAAIFIACFAREDMSMALVGIAFGLVPLLGVCTVLYLISRHGGKPVFGVNFREIVKGTFNSICYFCGRVEPRNMVNPPSTHSDNKPRSV